MPLVPIQLPIRSNRSKHGYEGDARIVNGYIEELGADAEFPFAAYAMAGLTTWSTPLADVKIRAALVIAAKLYVVAGRSCFVVDAAGTASNLGGVPTDGPVYMARNRRDPAEIGIVSDGLYFVIDTGTDTLTDVLDTDLPASTSFDVLDGYGILPGTGDKWFITNADDFTNIDGLDFAKAESSPDKIIRVKVFNREAWLFGEETTETWQNTGGQFPLSRSSSFQLGCMAAGTVNEIDNKLIWVDQTGVVRMSNGAYGGARISNHGVERAIKAETNQVGMTSTTWTDEGHHFYVLNGSTFSYQFDTVTGSWSERSSYNLNRWRIETVVPFNGNLIAGDYTNGKLYTMSSSTYDEAGSPLVMTVQPPPIHGSPEGLEHNELEIQIVPGTGLNSSDTDNSDPQLIIDWTEDGGKTYRGVRHRPIGALGKTQTRVTTRRLGTQYRNNRHYRFRVSAAVAKGILAVTAYVEGADS